MNEGDEILHTSTQHDDEIAVLLERTAPASLAASALCNAYYDFEVALERMHNAQEAYMKAVAERTAAYQQLKAALKERSEKVTAYRDTVFNENDKRVD